MITLEQICKVTENELYFVLKDFLQKNYNKVIIDKNYLLAEGTIPIVLIAHLDTVFNSPSIKIFHDQKEKIKWGLGGAGFDDRAGVWAIIRLIKEGYKPHVIFTKGEEIGGIGASAVAANPMPFAEARFLIELDRQGRNDCVFYNCGNKEFQAFIESFGFKTATGTFSDISVIAPAWDLAAVNLSIGYEYEHSESEIFHTDWFEEIYSKIKLILSSETMQYDYQETHEIAIIQCPCCSHSYPFSIMIGIQYSEDRNLFLCGNCFEQAEAQISWCEKCGEPYLTKEKRNKCYHCGKKENKFVD